MDGIEKTPRSTQRLQSAGLSSDLQSLSPGKRSPSSFLERKSDRGLSRPLGPSRRLLCQLCLQKSRDSLFGLGPGLRYLSVWNEPFSLSAHEENHPRRQRQFLPMGSTLQRGLKSCFRRKSFFLATTRDPSEKESGDSARSIRPYRFLFIGRLEKVKGIDLLLQAMAGLKEDGREAHLTVVGRGSLEELGQRFYWGREDLGRRSRCWAMSSDETLVSLYASSDCVVIPSRFGVDPARLLRSIEL